MNSNAIQMFAIGLAGLFVLCIVVCMYLISIYYDVKELQKALVALRRFLKDKDDCCNHVTNNDAPFQVSKERLTTKTSLENQGNHPSAKVKDE